MLDAYWAEIDRQLVAVRFAKTPAEVITIIGKTEEEAGAAFFGGDGDDLLDALYSGGWTSYRYGAFYYWVVRAPDGLGLISYTEGDVDEGDNPAVGPVNL